MWWLGLCALALGLVGLLSYYLPVSVSSSLQARAEPSGSWALALGIGVGPLALSAILAHGVQPFVTCHVFGRQLLRLPLSRRLRARKKSADASSSLEPRSKAQQTRIERALGRFFSELDPLSALWSWWEKERVFEVRSLELDVEYSFRDVALTGQILAGLCMLSGVLPERYVIQQTPRWESEDRVSLAADGKFRIWPVRLTVDVLGFVLKQRSMARRSAVPASE